jgi:Fe2+ or Zn2+ uptake regulation protein
MGLTGKYRVYLAANGKRLTVEREAILAEALMLPGAFDIEQLFNRVSIRTGPRQLSRATTYRTLLELVEAAVMRRVDESSFETLHCGCVCRANPAGRAI